MRRNAFWRICPRRNARAGTACCCAACHTQIRASMHRRHRMIDEATQTQTRFWITHVLRRRGSRVNGCATAHTDTRTANTIQAVTVVMWWHRRQAAIAIRHDDGQCDGRRLQKCRHIIRICCIGADQLLCGRR